MAKVIIVLDPGHGTTPGNEGGQVKKYKLKGDRKIYDIGNLPEYAIEDPDKYIDGDNESSNHAPDKENTESNIVYDVAVKMKEMLEESGYTVYLTRSQRKVVFVAKELNFKEYSLSSSPNEATSVYYRSDMATKLKADYFISIHADSANSFASGAHTIYTSDEESRQLAIDLISYYDVADILKRSPDNRHDLAVLGSRNKSKKKVLVEIGFLSNPKDAISIINNKDKIAEQLVRGLEKNINKNK